MEGINTGRPKSARFSLMTDEQILEYCRSLYDAHGPTALTFQALKSHDNLYFALHVRGIGQRALLIRLGLTSELKSYRYTLKKFRDGKRLERWTWERICEVATEAQLAAGHLPPAAWFQANGKGALVGAIYNHGKTWEDLRAALADFNSSQFVESRSGIRWRSHPEASLSNFLYARGIEHRRGERYPEAYSEATGRAYGLYDLHFQGLRHEIDVEIWGDKPNGHGSAAYAEKRRGKELFNAGNPRFLGISFRDCFSDDKLSAILEPFIGLIPAFRFTQAIDHAIESSHWSNADELLEFCRHLASQMPDGAFPNEEWLRKRGKFASREGPAYNTLSVYIKLWIGGIRKLRELLGQPEMSTQQWDEAKTLERWRGFWDKHGVTPSQVRHSNRQKASQFPKDVLLEANNLANAAARYAGGADAANTKLGITPARARKWPRHELLNAYRKITGTWGATPGQVLSDFQAGKTKLTADEARWIGQVIDASTRNGGSRELCEAIGFITPKRPRRKRTPKRHTPEGPLD